MPICSKCGNDNPDNQGRCAKCGADLSPALPPEETTAGTGAGLVLLATFHTISEADMVQELLESNGITTMLRGENDPIGAMSGAEPMNLMVEKESLERAKELYDAFFAGDVAGSNEGPEAEGD